MASSVFSCVICGWCLAEAPGTHSWALEYRGIFQGPDGIQLTGVGCNDPEAGELAAPRDVNARWDDPGHSATEDVQFGAMRQREINNRYGFILHESCWQIFNTAAAPSPVSLQRFYDVCRSIPMSFGVQGLDWGHDYGGFLMRHDRNLFSWERRREDPDIYGAHPVYGSDPYVIPELARILTTPPSSPPRWAPSEGGRASNPNGASGDIFERLPTELRHAIAAFLLTSDALRLRQASPAFWDIFDSQQFWGTRFQRGGERSWFFETQRPSQYLVDWRWLFRCFNPSDNRPALANRARVWTLSEKLVELLTLQETPDPANYVDETDAATDLSEDMATASAMLWRPRIPKPGQHVSHVFDLGCRAFYHQSLQLPDDLDSISISKAQVGDSSFIAGLSFQTTSGSLHHLGYRTDSRETQRVREITGFVLAIGPRGIQGIQCVSSSGIPETRWLGSAVSVPKTARLAASSCPINRMKVTFDGCKILSMAVDRVQDDTGSQTSLDPAGDLRHSLTWYPDIPSRSLVLNKPSITTTDFSQPSYQPWFWAHFGGHGGSLLAKLTRISTPHSPKMRLVQFFYDDSKVPDPHHNLGAWESEPCDRTDDFLIDGPGGERITSVIVARSLRPGHSTLFLVAIQFATNRGRSCRFGDDSVLVAPEHLETLEVAAGSVITGLYAKQPERPDLSRGFTALGVISEPMAD